MSRTKDDKTQKTFKVVLLGDCAVGKTCIIKQFVGLGFGPFEEATLGGVYYPHKFKRQDETSVQLDIWDTPGQDRYESLWILYYKDADGIIMVYDITDKDSFEQAMDRINGMLNRNEVFHITIELFCLN